MAVVKSQMLNANEVYQQTLLKAVKYNSVFEQKGLVLGTNITGHEYVRWFRVNRVAPGDPGDQELGEGVNPTETAMSIEKVTGTIKWYGAFTKVTSAARQIDPVKATAQFTKVMGEMARETRENIIRDEYLSNSTNIRNASGAAAVTSINATVSEADLRNMFRTMEKAGAEKITQIVKAGAGNNTYPIEACYLLYVTPDQAMDIRALTNFKKTAEYSNPDVAFEGEIGACQGWRIISTNLLTASVLPGSAAAGGTSVTGHQTTDGSHCDVHRAIGIGKEALGVANLDGGIQSIVKSEEQIGGALNQYSTTGYKMAMCAETFNSNWVIIYRTAVSS